MEGLKCSIVVTTGILVNDPTETREWHFTQADLDSPPAYIDGMGAAMNYAASLMNPAQVNWVRLEWIWY